MTRIAAEDLTAAADPNVVVDPSAAEDLTAVVVHIAAAPWAILSVLTLALPLAQIAAAVPLVAAP